MPNAKNPLSVPELSWSGSNKPHGSLPPPLNVSLSRAGQKTRRYKLGRTSLTDTAPVTQLKLPPISFTSEKRSGFPFDFLERGLQAVYKLHKEICTQDLRQSLCRSPDRAAAIRVSRCQDEMSGLAVDEEELAATHTGPKGVISDWRRFKLETEDHDTILPGRRELLRQMSNPQKPEESRKYVNRKMSMQEYELIKQEDERCLHRYRKQCMQEMHQRLSFGPRFEGVFELENGEAFLDIIEKEHRLTVVVVHVYEDDVPGCEALNDCLGCLATEYPTVRFCKIRASRTGASDRFSRTVLPAVLVYKAGDLLGNFLCVRQHLSEEFFEVDVEAFLNEYGFLPEKESSAYPGDEEEDANVE